VFDYYFTLADPEAPAARKAAIRCAGGLDYDSVWEAWRKLRAPDVARALAGELPPFELYGLRWERYGGPFLPGSLLADCNRQCFLGPLGKVTLDDGLGSGTSLACELERLVHGQRLPFLEGCVDRRRIKLFAGLLEGLLVQHEHGPNEASDHIQLTRQRLTCRQDAHAPFPPPGLLEPADPDVIRCANGVQEP
jgi:hypothetical protein